MSLERLIQGLTYVVRFPELERDTYVNQIDMYIAEGLEAGCSQLILVAKPDTLFPLNGNSKNYKVAERTIRAASKPPFDLATLYTAVIDTAEYDERNPMARNALVVQCREALTKQAIRANLPGRYVISLRSGLEIERGRV